MKPQTVQIVRQGEATPYWFKVNPLYIQTFIINPSKPSWLTVSPTPFFLCHVYPKAIRKQTKPAFAALSRGIKECRKINI